MLSAHCDVESINHDQHVQKTGDIDKDVGEIVCIGTGLTDTKAAKPAQPVENAASRFGEKLEAGKEIRKLRVKQSPLQPKTDART